MKTLASLLALLLAGCTTLTGPTGTKQIASTFSIDQRRAFPGDATTLASIAAGIYGGPAASAGLNALGTVMQGYVGKLIPSAVVAASPGVGQLGVSAVPLVSSSVPVSQADVTAIFTAAKTALTK